MRLSIPLALLLAPLAAASATASASASASARARASASARASGAAASAVAVARARGAHRDAHRRVRQQLQLQQQQQQHQHRRTEDFLADMDMGDLGPLLCAFISMGDELDGLMDEAETTSDLDVDVECTIGCDDAFENIVMNCAIEDEICDDDEDGGGGEFCGEDTEFDITMGLDFEDFQMGMDMCMTVSC